MGRPKDGRGDLSDGDNKTKSTWGVVIPRGRDDLFNAINVLVKCRNKTLGAKKIECPFGIKAEQVSELCKDWPKYLLLLGGVDEIPFEVQRELVIAGKFVGRLVFPNVEDYKKYAEYVVTWEKKPARAGSDFGCVIVTDSRIGFYHKPFGESQPSPFAEWPGKQGDLHPMQLIQQALKRKDQPFPILARVPLQWLERSPRPADLHAKNLPWSSLDLEKDKALWPRSLRKAAKEGEKVGVGELLSTDFSTNVRPEHEEDAKLSDHPMGNLVLGDPAILLGAVATDKPKTQARAG